MQNGETSEKKEQYQKKETSEGCRGFKRKGKN
jgi:hypothetical protein